uniref:Glycosyltransferase subfamily 4-like N-terminal domain-containing protein n=1 Tax=Kalanchoe fedtschenkoi TaxID=63787 RepID=A0A7N0UFN0_KALFE
MAINHKTKKAGMVPSSRSNLCTTLFFIVLFTVPALFLLHTTKTISICSSMPNLPWSWSGDLRQAEFAWNHLQFSKSVPPPLPLKIAVFSRKWPMSKTPGGMERHAQTLHMALAHRGHRIHVYTSPPDEGNGEAGSSDTNVMPVIHWHEGGPGKWKYRSAWELFDKENQHEAFDVVHSESVALPHWLARNVPNLAVTWHGIALEALHSTIYQDLARGPNDSVSATFKIDTDGVIPKVLNEIRFFKSYAHHVAISDSCGEMLRDVYQIPNKRVHVIINGVDEDDFQDHGQVATKN